MTLTRSSGKVSGSGDWATNEKLKSSQMNHIEGELVNAVDGYSGGNYEPSSTIVIEGDGGGSGYGAEVDNLNVEITLDINGNVTVNSGGQALFEGTTIIKGASPWIEIQNSSGNPISFNYVQPLAPLPIANSAGDKWTFPGGKWVQADTSSQYVMVFPFLHLPAFGTITDVTVELEGNGGGGAGHGGGISNLDMPIITVYDGGWNNIGSDTDGSANAVAYDGAHNLEVTGLSSLVRQDGPHYVRIQGESGADSVNSCLSINKITVAVQLDVIGP